MLVADQPSTLVADQLVPAAMLVPLNVLALRRWSTKRRAVGRADVGAVADGVGAGTKM